MGGYLRMRGRVGLGVAWGGGSGKYWGKMSANDKRLLGYGVLAREIHLKVKSNYYINLYKDYI